MKISTRLALACVVLTMSVACGEEPVRTFPPGVGSGVRLQLDRVIRLGTAPSLLTPVDGGRLVLISDAGSPILSVLDTEAGQIGTFLIPDVERTAGVTVSDDLLFVADVEGSRVFVYDFSSRTQTREPLLVGESANLVAGSSDDRYLIGASFAFPGLVRVFDSAFGYEQPGPTIVLGAQPADLVVGRQSNLTRAYLLGRERGTVFEIDYGVAPQVTDSLSTGAPAAFLALSEDGRRLYVSSDASNRVLGISVGGLFVEQTIRVAAGPLGLDVSPDGRYVVVACEGADVVALVDVELGLTIDELLVGTGADPNPLDVCFIGLRTCLVSLQNEPGVAILDIVVP